MSKLPNLGILKNAKIQSSCCNKSQEISSSCNFCSFCGSKIKLDGLKNSDYDIDERVHREKKDERKRLDQIFNPTD